MAVNLHSKLEFDAFVAQQNRTVIVDFYADWCGPCQMLSPILDAIESEKNGAVVIGKVNVDENMDLAMAYKVVSIPFAVIFKNGTESGRFVGLQSKEEIEAML